ncbi:hypothetical protein BOTBODRAFT_30328 [Botryobasidium botryosum FD-172 SS1]|uniref:Protein kinase domain-containing protein n=1 Tax=Botryobasidium botryosum (strain FD-172 SS1) TaxID=930990 RepID=A0A067MN33_BOTB1|nr:hypothetical protein BOTBODRAFT_30328 [Botryobasidium botryosum FD-172 SS1]
MNKSATTPSSSTSPPPPNPARFSRMWSSLKGTSRTQYIAQDQPPPPPEKDDRWLQKPTAFYTTAQGSLSTSSINSSTIPATPLSSASSNSGWDPARSTTPASTSSSTAPAPRAMSGFKKALAKIPSVGKGPRKRPSMSSVLEDASPESISLPWNVQHHIHVEPGESGLSGLPPAWATALADVGFSDEEIGRMYEQRQLQRKSSGILLASSRSSSPPPQLRPLTPTQLSPTGSSWSLVGQTPKKGMSEASCRSGSPVTEASGTPNVNGGTRKPSYRLVLLPNSPSPTPSTTVSTAASRPSGDSASSVSTAITIPLPGPKNYATPTKKGPLRVVNVASPTNSLLECPPPSYTTFAASEEEEVLPPSTPVLRLPDLPPRLSLYGDNLDDWSTAILSAIPSSPSVVKPPPASSSTLPALTSNPSTSSPLRKSATLPPKLELNLSPLNLARANTLSSSQNSLDQVSRFEPHSIRPTEPLRIPSRSRGSTSPTSPSSLASTDDDLFTPTAPPIPPSPTFTPPTPTNGPVRSLTMLSTMSSSSIGSASFSTTMTAEPVVIRGASVATRAPAISITTSPRRSDLVLRKDGLPPMPAATFAQGQPSTSQLNSQWSPDSDAGKRQSPRQISPRLMDCDKSLPPDPSSPVLTPTPTSSSSFSSTSTFAAAQSTRVASPPFSPRSFEAERPLASSSSASSPPSSSSRSRTPLSSTPIPTTLQLPLQLHLPSLDPLAPSRPNSYLSAESPVQPGSALSDASSAHSSTLSLTEEMERAGIDGTDGGRRSVDTQESSHESLDDVDKGVSFGMGTRVKQVGVTPVSPKDVVAVNGKASPTLPPSASASPVPVITVNDGEDAEDEDGEDYDYDYDYDLTDDYTGDGDGDDDDNEESLRALAPAFEPLVVHIDRRDPTTLFTNLTQVADGQYGPVFAAHVATLSPPSAATPTVVAVKTITIDNPWGAGGSSSAKASKVQALRAELDIMSQVRHPHILSTDALYVHDDVLWVEMELMERSLADLLALVMDGLVIDEMDAARLASDAAHGLAYLQSLNIAHRDVRSDNLLLSKDGFLKLADFSHAIHVSPPRSKRLSMLSVPPYWMAPEMRNGQPYDAHLVDVWGLGATVWELIEGSPPFVEIEDPQQFGDRWPEFSMAESYSLALHHFLRLCSEPVATRPRSSELLQSPFIRTAGPRRNIVQLLAKARQIEQDLQQ